MSLERNCDQEPTHRFTATCITASLSLTSFPLSLHRCLPPSFSLPHGLMALAQVTVRVRMGTFLLPQNHALCLIQSPLPFSVACATIRIRLRVKKLAFNRWLQAGPSHNLDTHSSAERARSAICRAPLLPGEGRLCSLVGLFWKGNINNTHPLLLLQQSGQSWLAVLVVAWSTPIVPWTLLGTRTGLGHQMG
jgi:hypothetical protein